MYDIIDYTQANFHATIDSILAHNQDAAGRGAEILIASHNKESIDHIPYIVYYYTLYCIYHIYY